MILVVDSYDSFVFNLVQYIGALGEEVVTVRNDELDVSEALALCPSRIVLSPGPGTPQESGILLDLVRSMDGTIPLFGVCLGQQAIGEVYGGEVVPAPTLMHGKIGLVHHDGTGVHRGIPSPFKAVRYHSLVVDPRGMSTKASVNAWSDDQLAMGLAIPALRIHGVQYHPESLLTEHGREIVHRFLYEV